MRSDWLIQSTSSDLTVYIPIGRGDLEMERRVLLQLPTFYHRGDSGALALGPFQMDILGAFQSAKAPFPAAAPLLLSLFAASSVHNSILLRSVECVLAGHL